MATKTTTPTPLSGPQFTEDEWPAAENRNPFAEVTAQLNGTDRTMSTTAPDKLTAQTWVNQLHRAGAAIGKTVRTRVADTPDGRVVIRFKVVPKQTKRSNPAAVPFPRN